MRLIAALFFACIAFAQTPGWFVKLPPATRKDVAGLQQHADRQQASLRTWLASRKVGYRAFWINNSLYLPRADAKLLDELRAAGYTVEQEPIVRLEPVPSPAGNTWGIERIRAPEVWQQGERGKGVLIAVVDTGIDVSHPALKQAWSGLWHDPSGICQGTVCDNNGHGTHVSGTIAGADGIGVAPEARIAACKGCESSWCSASSLLACAEWVLTLNPKPFAVNNSWGGGYSTWYKDAVAAYLAAGIVPVFASGNPGGYCGGVNAPGAYCDVVAVGATDSTDTVADFSGRGPSPEGCIRPLVSAPGVGVYSALPGGGYGSMSGTSMATPHVTGALALLARKAGSGERAVKALVDTARRIPSNACGENPDVPNNAYGWGRIDVKAAWDSITSPPPPPPPKNEPPSVRIVEPADGSRVRCGTVVRLKAEAFDKEDGDLSDQVVWWAVYPFWKGRQAEHIGAGGVGCELGWHVYRAEVSDSAGEKAVAEIRIEVVP